MIQILQRRESLEHEWAQLHDILDTDEKEASAEIDQGWEKLSRPKGPKWEQTGFLRPSVHRWIITLPDAIWSLSPRVCIQENKGTDIFWKELGSSYYTRYWWYSNEYDTDQVSWSSQRVMFHQSLSKWLSARILVLQTFWKLVRINRVVFYC